MVVEGRVVVVEGRVVVALVEGRVRERKKSEGNGKKERSTPHRKRKRKKEKTTPPPKTHDVGSSSSLIHVSFSYPSTPTKVRNPSV